MRRVLIPSLVAAVLVMAGAVAGAAGASTESSASARPRSQPVQAWTDFDGDGRDDLAIGAPYDDVAGKAAAGVVHVLYGRPGGLAAAASQLWHQDRANVSNLAEAGDHFGWSLATGDFDGDGFADLAIGVPDEDIGPDANRGGINVLFGSANGLQARASQVLVSDSDVAAGGRLGYALAAFDARDTGALDCPAGSDDIAEIVAGAPGDVNGQGTIKIFTGSFLVSVGYDCGERTTRIVAGTPGAAGGRSVATGDVNGDGLDDIVAGAPLDDVIAATRGALADAGTVAIFNGATFNLAAVWHQGDDLGNVAEVGDQLGAAVAVGDIDNDANAEVAIGAPAEDTPAGADAGLVHVVLDFDVNDERVLHEDAAGVPGTGSAGDRFGAALEFGGFVPQQGRQSLAIGVPGDDVAGRAGAGAVVVMYQVNGDLQTTGNARWQQDSVGILDAAEAGDGFGSSLYSASFDGNSAIDLVVGVPRENLGSIADAGAVAVLYAADDTMSGLTAQDDFWHQDIAGVGGVAQAGDRFGFGLP